MDKNSYRQIIKGTSIFGGVQIFNIIIQIVRSKIIAVLLGPLGMGISGLLTSTTGLVSSITGFGLGTSSVKNISEANSSNNKARIEEISSVLKYLIFTTGILGVLTTIILSRWLSIITFGNTDYTLAFIWVSLSLLFSQISSGQSAVLQGMRKLKYLASANIFGNILSLAVTVPLYFIWRINAIVPAIILSSAISMGITWIYSRKLKIARQNLPVRKIIKDGKGMIIMGFMLSLSGLITMGTSYLIRIYISNTGNIEQVGLYSAGFSIITNYVGIVLSAMGTDYYPRLSAVAKDNSKSKEMINQQAEISILILSPILMLFIVFINYIILLLYSSAFLAIKEMILWAAIGMFFKAASWSVGFIILARGESKVFFWNELIANIYILILNIIGFKYGNLEGLGISFTVGYIIYLIQVFLLAKYKYEFKFFKPFLTLFLIQLVLGVICFILARNFSGYIHYAFGTIIIIISVLYSYIELNKRLNIKSIFFSIKNRYFN